MEEKPSDDEKPNYITKLNTVRANQGIASSPEVIIKIIFTSQNRTLLLKANHKKDHSYFSDNSGQSKYYLKTYMEELG